MAEFTDLGIQISGIITLISLGLFMSAFGKTRINPESDHAVHVFWHYAVYAAETIIFIFSGVIVGVKCLNVSETPSMIWKKIDKFNQKILIYKFKK